MCRCSWRYSWCVNNKAKTKYVTHAVQIKAKVLINTDLDVGLVELSASVRHGLLGSSQPLVGALDDVGVGVALPQLGLGCLQLGALQQLLRSRSRPNLAAAANDNGALLLRLRLLASLLSLLLQIIFKLFVIAVHQLLRHVGRRTRR